MPEPTLALAFAVLCARVTIGANDAIRQRLCRIMDTAVLGATKLRAITNITVIASSMDHGMNHLLQRFTTRVDRAVHAVICFWGNAGLAPSFFTTVFLTVTKFSIVTVFI